MKTTYKPRIESLEDRMVPASVVIPESTFSTAIFAQNIEAAMNNTVVGYGYAVTGPNGVIVEEGGGSTARTAIDGELAFTSTSSMEIASSAKTITAAALVKALFDQGLTVSEPIGGYFPSSWTVPAAVASLTFEDLLNHTSGFNVRRLTYEDLKELVADGPQVAQEDSGYNTTNYSLLRVLLPYVWYGNARSELDDIDEADKPQALADLYFEYVTENVLEPLGVSGADTGHTSATPTLLYSFPDDGNTPGFETPDQRLNVGGMGWNMSAAQLATFMAGLSSHPDFTAVYQAMKDGELGLSDTSSGLFGTYYAKGGNNFPGSDGDNRANTIMVDFPNDVQVAMVQNSDGGSPVMRTSYENAWTGLVVQGDDGANVFELRLNPADPNLLDLVIDGDLFFSFRLDVLSTLELRGLGGNDTFRIEDVPESVSLILDGGSQHDTFEFGTGGNAFDTIQGSLTVLGGDGVDHLDVRDANGIGSHYAVEGIDSTEITHDGVITASGYNAGKLFVYDAVEEITLEGNTDANHITVRGITPGMTVNIHAGFNDDTVLVSDLASGVKVNVHGEGGNDAVMVWDIAAGSTVNVLGDALNVPGGADTLTVGKGDLGTVGGHVFFSGAGGNDLLFLDDRHAPVGRKFEFTATSVTGSAGFGGASYTNVETVRLFAGERDDTVNVESLHATTDLEVYGNLGSDVFTVAAKSHNVDPVAGDVILHGESGIPQGQDTQNAAPVENDQLLVFDDANPAAGEFALGLHGSAFRGRLRKLGLSEAPRLNVIYDQIETTELRAGLGDDTIVLTAAPWFNRVMIHAGDGNDLIDVESTPSFAQPTQVHGGAGADVIRVSPTGKTLNALPTMLMVDGGAGAAGENDLLLVSDALSANVAPYTLSDSQLSRAGTAGVGYAGIEGLAVGLNNLDNLISVTGTPPGTAVQIDGAGGNDRLVARNLASAVTFHGGAGANDSARLIGTSGADTIVVQGHTMTLGNGSLTTTGVEKREVHGHAGRDRLELRGVAGVDEAFILWPSTKPNSGRVNYNPFGPVTYDMVEEMFAEGNPGDKDTLVINGQTTPVVLGGVHHDRFTLNLAAEGTAKSPFLVLRNHLGQPLLTLSDYQGISAPKVNGLLGSDTFDVHASAAGTSRRVQLDGGGQSGTRTGDQLRVHFAPKGAKATWTRATPKGGKVAIDYSGLFHSVLYQGMEQTSLHRRPLG